MSHFLGQEYTFGKELHIWKGVKIFWRWKFRKVYQSRLEMKMPHVSNTFWLFLNPSGSFFQACVCYLLNSPSKQAMHDRFRKEFEYVWPKDFVLYYRQRLLPRSGRLGRWAMAKLNICENSFLSPHANPQERFFKLVNGFRHWENLSLEQLIRAFNYLFVFFINELSLR